MTTPVAIRDAIVTTLRAAYTKTTVPTIDSHDGEVTAAALERKTLKTPALLVACLDLVRTTSELGSPAGMYRWAVFVVARLPKPGTTEKTRGDVAMALAADVARRVHGEDWGGLALEDADRVRAQNLWRPELSARGAVLWVVTWEQAAAFDPLVDAAALDDLLLIHSEFALKPGTEGTEPSTTDVQLEGAS